MKKKILIIGSEGLIGSNLYSCLEKKYDIYKVDIKLKNSKKNFRINLNNKSNLEKLFDNFIKKKIYFSTIINAAYPKSNSFTKSFINSIIDFEKNIHSHLTPFYATFLLTYNYFKKIKKKGHLISLSSIYGAKIPNFKIYKNTNIKSPVSYSAAKAAIIILNSYFSEWSKYSSLDISFTTVSPAGIRNDQSKIFKSNYTKIYQSTMLEPRQVSKKISQIILQPKKFNGKNILITNGINL